MTTHYALISYKNTDYGYGEAEETLISKIQTIYRTYRFVDNSKEHYDHHCPSYSIDVIRLVPPKVIRNGNEDYWNHITAMQLSWMDKGVILEAILRHRKFDELVCHVLEQDSHVYLNKIMALLPKDRVGIANINSFVGSLTS